MNTEKGFVHDQEHNAKNHYIRQYITAFVGKVEINLLNPENLNLMLLILILQ